MVREAAGDLSSPETTELRIAHFADIYGAVAKLCRAFDPLVCAADIYNFEQQLRYRVFDPVEGLPIVCVTGVSVRKLIDPKQLHAEIALTRMRLQRLGFTLFDRDTATGDAAHDVFRRPIT